MGGLGEEVRVVRLFRAAGVGENNVQAGDRFRVLRLRLGESDAEDKDHVQCDGEKEGESQSVSGPDIYSGCVDRGGCHEIILPTTAAPCQ